jgi:soluble lytic murein transglycosylase-like protein
MKTTNLLQAMINLQNLRSMTQTNNLNSASTETESMFQQILNEAQTNQEQTIKIQSLRNTAPSKTINASDEVQEVIEATAMKYGVDPKLISAMIQQESNFQANAVSKSGAMGLMQLMPRTAKSLGVSDPFDVKQNIEGGTKYISQLLNKYNGNTTLALAAYNAGPGNIEKYSGIPPFKETQNYVRNVLNNYQA